MESRTSYSFISHKSFKFKDLCNLYKHLTISKYLHPSILEQSYYHDPHIFHILVQHSARAAVYITRPGICISAKQGVGKIRQYLETRLPPLDLNKMHFLELVLMEQFLSKGHNIDLDLVRGLIEYGVDPSLTSIGLESHVLLCRLVLQMVYYGIDNDNTVVLAQLIHHGADINSEVLQYSVERNGIDVLKLLTQHGADIKTHGLAALCMAARLDNYEAVSWLLKAGVDINSGLGIGNVWLSIIMASNISTIPLSWSPQRQQGPDLLHSKTASCEMTTYLIRHGAKLMYSPGSLNAFDFLYNFLAYSDVHTLDKIKIFFDVGLSYEDLLDPHKCLLEASLAAHSPNPEKERLEIFEFLFTQGLPVRSSPVLPALIHHGGQQDLVMKLLDTGVDINAYPRVNYDLGIIEPLSKLQHIEITCPWLSI